jgi:hypothetical protein
MIRWICITAVVVLAAGLFGVETVLIVCLALMGLAAVLLCLLHLGLKDFQGY